MVPEQFAQLRICHYLGKLNQKGHNLKPWHLKKWIRNSFRFFSHCCQFSNFTLPHSCFTGLGLLSYLLFSAACIQTARKVDHKWESIPKYSPCTKWKAKYRELNVEPSDNLCSLWTRIWFLLHWKPLPLSWVRREWDCITFQCPEPEKP